MRWKRFCSDKLWVRLCVFADLSASFAFEVDLISKTKTLTAKDAKSVRNRKAWL